MASSLPRPPAFLPLLAAYPVLFLATANPGQVDWLVAAGVSLVAAIGAVVAFWVLNLLVRSPLSAAVGAGLVVLLFFTYGQAASWIDAYLISLRLGNDQTPNVLDLLPNGRLLLAVAWAGLGVLGAWLVARSQWAARPKIAPAITVAVAALYGMAAVAGFMTRDGGTQRLPGSAAPLAQAATTGAQRMPDLYFIVLDGYARADVLARYYGFDNSPFLDALRDRGFQVSGASSSNYNWTFLALASTLNLGYLHEMFDAGIGADSADVSLLYESIRNSLTARFLRARGYRIVHFQSTWGATARNPYADREVRCEFSVYTNEFVRAVVEATWLGAFHSKAGVDLARCHQANFAALAAMGAEPGPKFVFAHFVLPHHPYLFDRDGNVLRAAIVSNQFEFQKKLWEDRASYRSQLEFVNGQILRAVDGIIEGSPVPPIIVIESDHGPGLNEGLQPEDRVAVRLATLGAYHLPGAPPGLMPAGTSAVNQFRVILSHYFEAPLPPLPDRHFYSPFSRPYAFQEVPHELLRNWWTRLDGQRQDQAPTQSEAVGEENRDDSEQ